ncbi:hypothetical protein ACFFX0_04245 [Citricoccus parietis]|uniref:Uncharacterized protein n=1 Tax=Citricoccus parietis TaxID=592307 RepID=A0ABV5FUT4_9MICC
MFPWVQGAQFVRGGLRRQARRWLGSPFSPGAGRIDPSRSRSGPIR